MTQREAFEAWAKAQGLDTNRDGFGGGESQWIEAAFEGWQAAQAQAATVYQAAVEPVPDDIVEPLYDAIAIAAAHQAGRKSVHDKCVDLWKDEFLAAARVAALEEAALMAEGHYGDGHRLAEEIRALIDTNLTTGEIK